MNLKYNDYEFNMKLRSLKQMKNESQQKIYMEQSPTHRGRNNKKSKQKNNTLYLSNVIKNMKINNLVRLFVYKLRRNIANNNRHDYNLIQDKMSKQKQDPDYIRSFNLNQHIRAIIISLDIICILVIQTLSTFQGFYDDYIVQDSVSLPIILIEIFCLIIFFLKLVMQFTTPRDSQGMKNQYIRFIAKEYVKSIIFVFNLFNFVMTIFKVIFPQSKVVGIVSFVISVLSMPVLSEDLQIVEATWINNFTKKQYFTMFKVLLFNLFFVQFISTMLVAVSFFDTQENWIEKAIRNGVMREGLNWWQQYFYALYFAIVTSATIGFGDLTPANYLQTGIMCVLMILGTAVLSFNVSSIGHIVESLRSIDEERKGETIIFKRMCKDQKISPELANKISDYIYKAAQFRSEFDFIERKIFLDKLPPQFRKDLQSQYADNIFSKIPFFRLLSHQTLVNFSLKLKGQIYYPGQDMIMVDGKLSKIMFLKHGQIGFGYNKKGSKLNKLILQSRYIDKDNDTPFLLNKNLLSRTRKLNYRLLSQTYCVMLELQYDDFRNTLKQSNKDNELYFQTLNSMSQIDEQWEIFQCTQCAPKKHTIYMCPKLHYMPYKSLIHDRYLYSPSIPQSSVKQYKRKQNQRKNKQSLHYWRKYFKKYELKWEINYDKRIVKRTQIQADSVVDETVTSPTFTDRIIAFHNKIKPQQIQKPINEESIVNLAQKILEKHCCEITKKSRREIQPMEMDIMCNYTNFFPKFNPEHFFKLSLKYQKRTFYIKQDPC